MSDPRASRVRAWFAGRRLSGLAGHELDVLSLCDLADSFSQERKHLKGRIAILEHELGACRRQVVSNALQSDLGTVQDQLRRIADDMDEWDE